AYVESDFDEEIGDLSDEDFDNGEALDDQDIIGNIGEDFDEDFDLDFDDDEEEFAEELEDEDFDGDFEEDFEEEEFEEEDFEEEDSEEEDFEEEDFEDDSFEEADFDDEDFFDDDDDEEDDEKPAQEDLEIEEPSEEEIQDRIKKSKGGGVPFDTGFVVTGRYDLSATSEIGLKAGLTEEQKKLFSYFVPVRGMSEQIVEVLDNDRRAQREGTSKTGNLMVIGRKGSGKTVLAVDIVKAIQKQRNLKQGKVAIVTGESLNKKELTNIIQKLRGGAIIIEKAGKLNSRTIKELNYLMEKKTGELLFVLEDQRKPLERILTANPDFKKKFTSKLELPVFINDELVTFGQTYAKENGYKLDEMGILALYSRIDVMQREDHAVTVAEVKEIMDEAIAHSQKANVKHLARRVFGKSTDDSDRIILKEEDFKI
ncbi:MAG: NB-ARC domain-containing protein, partial [[Clostridium] scindens]|nr:NB-ARC domain-containing protein [[Clostridium] scindens]